MGHMGSHRVRIRTLLNIHAMSKCKSNVILVQAATRAGRGAGVLCGDERQCFPYYEVRLDTK